MTTPELQESDDFLDPALLVPVKGKVYRIEPLSSENALIIQKARIAAAEAYKAGKDLSELTVEGIDDDEPRATTERRLFGDTYDELIADGVNDVVRFRMTQIVMLWTFSGFDAAKAYVATGGKAVTMPNRADRRTATRSRTASASTTRKRASATGTSTRKATAEAAASGKTSSTTGTPSKPTSKTSA